jgi:hypothetical protein
MSASAQNDHRAAIAMDEAHKIIINTDGISDAEKLTPKFQKAYAEMLAQLTAPGFAHVLACHEAAHLFYLTMMGMKTYDPFPAKIEFDPATNDYGGTLASVTPGEIPPCAPGKFTDWFTLAAKAGAAGGVISRKLKSSPPPSKGTRSCGIEEIKRVRIPDRHAFVRSLTTGLNES